MPQIVVSLSVKSVPSVDKIFYGDGLLKGRLFHKTFETMHAIVQRLRSYLAWFKIGQTIFTIIAVLGDHEGRPKSVEIDLSKINHAECSIFINICLVLC